MGLRRAVAATTAAVLILEGLGLAAVHWVLSLVVRRQSMSLDGLDPDHMVWGTRIAGLALGAFVVLCGVAALLVAGRDRAPGRAARLVLIGCAVTHGVLGAVVVGLVGWVAFVALMVVLGLIVLTLLGYPEQRHEPESRGQEGPEPAAA
ncbi:hypothetical protein [Streptomyces sp. WMMC897]|uniref:hypothetical protein n=1 Tax=Streptomyces sp. WMMC897 TaxID=3014782 RepID=UPI0022B62F4B|nr:hypothetical protein [Streptomyces sp. WMMC897]MCZ7416898.1 hypothetical protein [Streptomyces sp. WMMC897]